MSITIRKTCKWRDFPAVDSCLSTEKAARGLKEKEVIFIMLLGLFALLPLPLDSKLPACLPPS